jgi:hypothetical protein
VNCAQTALELPGTDAAFSDLFAANPESLPAEGGDKTEMVSRAGAAVTGFMPHG